MVFSCHQILGCFFGSQSVSENKCQPFFWFFARTCIVFIKIDSNSEKRCRPGSGYWCAKWQGMIILPGFLYLKKISENILQIYSLVLIKIQTIDSVFSVYFNAEKSRYHFEGYFFEANLWSLGIKIMLTYNSLSQLCGSIMFIPKPKNSPQTKHF